MKFVLLALALLTPAIVLAAPAATVDEPTVVRRALARTAISDIIDGDVEAARGAAVELRTWQNPQLAYTREETYGPGGTGEDYLSLGQTLDIGGRRRLRGRAAMLRSEGAAARGESFKVALAAEVPLALSAGVPGSEIQAPMALVILCGLASSTSLNMFVVPALYARFHREAAPET